VGAEKVRRLVRVAQIREQRLADKAGALDAIVTALKPAISEPELADLLGEVERLAADLGREGDLIDIYRGVADDVMAADLQRRLYLDIADLALAVRDDASLARTFYQKVLDQQPDDQRALGALEGLYRRSGDVKALFEILGQKVELVSDPTEKLAALSELGTLASGVVDRPDDAINAWEQVLELDPSRTDAVAALDTLYRRERRWHDVVELYERRMGFAVNIDEAVALRIRLAEVQENQLQDRATAVDSYAAALGGDPSNAAAIAALERLVGDPGVRSAAAEVLEPLYIAPGLAAPGAPQRGAARGIERTGRTAGPDATDRPHLRGAARGSRGGVQVVRARVPRGSDRRQRARPAATAGADRRRLGRVGPCVSGAARRRAGRRAAPARDRDRRGDHLRPPHRQLRGRRQGLPARALVTVRRG
jgi:tetratricopeptide (TPR) repeat protein